MIQEMFSYTRLIRSIWSAARHLALFSILSVPSAVYAETRWSIGPAMKYDMVCLTGILANDNYQSQFYDQQREELIGILSAETVEAGSKVHQAFKDAGVPTAGFLALVFSTTTFDDIDSLIVELSDLNAAKSKLKASPYWNADRWAIYERVRPNLLTYLNGLKSSGFTKWWSGVPKNEVETILSPLRPRLDKIQFSSYIEKALARPGPTQITVHATRLCRPFGARLLGDVFLIDVVGKKDPFRSVGAGAIHEMTHPPFDSTDPRIVRLTELLRTDPILTDRFNQRPRNSGYNTFGGYLDEDMTRALDQLIGERVGVTFMDDANERFRTQEGGFHMAAAVFYHLMKEEKFLDGNESVTPFLDRMLREGRLSPDNVREIVARVEAKSP